MRVTVTGATGLIGTKLVAALKARGDEVTILSRRPGAGTALWEPEAEPAPVEALTGRDSVVHLAGESIGQRWTRESKNRIRSSREVGTAHLVEGLARAESPPRVLVTASAVGYYGPRGDEILDEDASPGAGFLADVCQAWERAAAAASDLGVRTVSLRTGVLIDRRDGGLARMLPAFRLGVGGPVAGGRQYLSWIAPDDLIRLYLAALDKPEWSGAFNATAPEPVTNHQFAQALGHALGRPAVVPVPSFAVQALYGEMASVVTTGQRVVPARALARGFEFRHATVGSALAAALREG